LRLEAGSTEAGFLAAFSDLSEIPTFVVIQNGQLQLQLKSHVSKNEFINSIRRVLGANPIPDSNPAPSPLQAGTIDSSDNQTNTAAEDDLYGDEEPSIPTPAQPAAAPPPSANAKGKQKMTSAPTSKPTSSGSVNKAQQEARDALRKKKREEAEELARVKARIEADKAARKAEAEVRKAERERERNKDAQTSAPRTTISSSKGSQAKTVSLNVRLFDGRTIRSTFPREATLQDQVRTWVDSEFSKLAQDDANINHKQLPPYYFRHILAPQPSRELSAGDENQSLGDIDLAPSATLVLVPVKGYTEAYSGSDGGVVGAATGLVGGAFGLLASGVGFVASAIGYGSQAAASSSSSASPSQGQQQPGRGHTMGSRPNQEAQHDAPGNLGIRVRTLADQRASEPQQFYNGNQVRFFCLWEQSPPAIHDADLA
jgi:hypothetical protein